MDFCWIINHIELAKEILDRQTIRKSKNFVYE